MKQAVNVLYLPGTNCHEETLRAFNRVGAEARLVFISDMLAGEVRLDDAPIVCIPGGFSYGDHAGAGAIAGAILRTRLSEQFAACRRRLMICICNGFQIALRAGCFGPDVSLTVNQSGTFNNAPTQEHYVLPSHGSPWLEGLEGETLEFPCAHGEGRFVYRSRNGWRPAITYPSDRNPDGSADGVAAISTPDGRVLALMNHPERAIHRSENLTIFENGVRAVAA
jgi:phosphoribosylformylglycinamidine (FGAM) synthase-like amidotransferase family enzyme